MFRVGGGVVMNPPAPAEPSSGRDRNGIFNVQPRCDALAARQMPNSYLLTRRFVLRFSSSY